MLQQLQVLQLLGCCGIMTTVGLASRLVNAAVLMQPMPCCGGHLRLLQ